MRSSQVSSAAEPASSGGDGAIAGTSGAAVKIRIERLTKEFVTKNRELVALDEISFDVMPGEFFTVVGPSGCGKSTLLRIVAGLELPSSGSVRVTAGSGERPVNSMVFQQESAFPWMTVWDNVAYGLRMRHVDRGTVHERVEEYLSKTALTSFAKAYPHELSGGMKQRVALARAFANDPEILLMDEPFSALDEQTRAILQNELLRIWSESEKTVLFITHSVDEAVTLGDQVVIMTAQPGRIKTMLDVPFGRPRDVLELRGEPAYGEMVTRIWGDLRSEVEQARAREVRGG